MVFSFCVKLQQESLVRLSLVMSASALTYKTVVTAGRQLSGGDKAGNVLSFSRHACVCTYNLRVLVLIHTFTYPRVKTITLTLHWPRQATSSEQ
jgi:hypothetical protein